MWNESSGSLPTTQKQNIRKRYSGIQPQYFPRLHYFARILNADIFILRDEAQFVRKHKYPDGSVDKSYQAHTPIKQSFGRHLLAVTTKHEGFKAIKDTEISYDHDWIKDHLKTLQYSYGNSQNFSLIYSEIEQLLNNKYKTLASLNNATIVWGLLKILGEENITKEKLEVGYLNEKLQSQSVFRLKKIIRSTETKAVQNFESISANEKIVALCKEVGAEEDYCGGTGASAYIDENIFDKNGILITVQDWKCKEYFQLFEDQGFIANLSIIDLLMNVSIPEAIRILKS